MNISASRSWQHVPERFRYIQKWAVEFGIRGLTVSFGKSPPRKSLASDADLVALCAAYEAIAQRNDAAALSDWCSSVSASSPAVDACEDIRGLLLLFERLGDHGLTPFSDRRVQYSAPNPKPTPLDWSVLPVMLREWEPWLRKFEKLKTEHDLYTYVLQATRGQLQELKALKALKDRVGDLLLSWCQANNNDHSHAGNEAFQAEWLFVLLDFAASRMEDN